MLGQVHVDRVYLYQNPAAYPRAWVASETRPLTGDLPLALEGHALDLARVVKAARENGKMLEIDGEPARLDLDDLWARKAMEAGVPLVIDSDAHSGGELENIGYGLLVARRAWLESKHVMNTKSLRALMNQVS